MQFRVYIDARNTSREPAYTAYPHLSESEGNKTTRVHYRILVIFSLAVICSAVFPEGDEELSLTLSLIIFSLAFTGHMPYNAHK